MDEKLIKEQALKNAELMTEEEKSIMSAEEVKQSVLSEFNKLADEIESEYSTKK